MKRLKHFIPNELFQRKEFFIIVIFCCGLLTPFLAKVADKVLHFFFNAPVGDNGNGYGFFAVIVFYMAAFDLIKYPAYLKLTDGINANLLFVLGLITSAALFQ